jgi:hypothetical protein
MEQLRTIVREGLLGLFEAEVTAFCCASYRPSKNRFLLAGSEDVNRRLRYLFVFGKMGLLGTSLFAFRVNFLLDVRQYCSKHVAIKVTFQIPDGLYRELKLETAREGLTLREVTISLFEQWLRQKNNHP